MHFFDPWGSSWRCGIGGLRSLATTGGASAEGEAVVCIIFGSRLTGKVDEVPGLFHVATRFGHVYYLPLFPLQSYIVLGRDGRRFRGVPIPLNTKSVLLAWARGLPSLAAVVATVVTWANWHSADWTN